MSARMFHDDAALHAALYLLSSLAPDEAAAYEEHLAGCSECQAEVSRLQDASSALALLAVEADPPKELRAKLFERISALADAGTDEVHAAEARPAQSWKDWAPSRGDGPIFVPAADTGWQPTGVAGVFAKGLFVDPEHDRVTMLVRMAAGSAYPAHRHGGPEECFLIEGDLDDGEISMHAGDYLRKDGGTLHGVQSSNGGCVMLIISSLHDELLATAPG